MVTHETVSPSYVCVPHEFAYRTTIRLPQGFAPVAGGRFAATAIPAMPMIDRSRLRARISLPFFLLNTPETVEAAVRP